MVPLSECENGDKEFFDDLYRCLQHSERRKVLFALLAERPQAPLSIPEDLDIEEAELEAWEIHFFHKHIPVLEESGLVRFDYGTKKLDKGPRFSEARDLLASIREYDPITAEE